MKDNLKPKISSITADVKLSRDMQELTDNLVSAFSKYRDDRLNKRKINVSIVVSGLAASDMISNNQKMAKMSADNKEHFDISSALITTKLAGNYYEPVSYSQIVDAVSSALAKSGICSRTGKYNDTSNINILVVNSRPSSTAKVKVRITVLPKYYDKITIDETAGETYYTFSTSKGDGMPIAKVHSYLGSLITDKIDKGEELDDDILKLYQETVSDETRFNMLEDYDK